MKPRARVPRPGRATAPSRGRGGSAALLRFSWILPALVAGIVHVGVLQNDFAYDDVRAIQLLQEGRIDPSGRFVAVEHGTALPRDQARRFTYALHALDHRLWGTASFGFHLTNLVLHMLAAALVYAAALLWTRTRWGAMVAALLFAVHPVHVEAVASFTNRKDILALIFDLAALLCWVRVRRLPLRLLAVAGLMTLGFLSKEAAVVGLPVILMAGHGQLGRREGVEPKDWQLWGLRILTAALATTLIGGLIWGRHLPPFAPDRVAAVTELQLPDFAHVVANSALGVLHLLRLLVFPALLSADYPLDQGATLTTPRVVLGLLALAALVALPLSLYRRHPRI